MRIICDHCGNPISGRVQKMAGNLNFHPDCLSELAKGPQQESAAASWESQERSVRPRIDADGRK